MDWPISTKEASRRIGITPLVASVLIRTHAIPTISHPAFPRFVGLSPESFAILREKAEGLYAKKPAIASA